MLAAVEKLDKTLEKNSSPKQTDIPSVDRPAIAQHPPGHSHFHPKEENKNNEAVPFAGVSGNKPEAHGFVTVDRGCCVYPGVASC